MYDVLSPDGFSITMDESYLSEKEAQTAINKFVKKYEKQGYYSMSDRTKITLEDLYFKCQIIKA